MARRRFVRSGSALRQGQRRQTLWIAGVLTNNTLATNSVTRLGTLNAAALALRPFTIVRTRGVLFMSSDQVAVSEQQGIGYGHVVISDEAVAAGVGSQPTPESESGSDFHVYEWMFGSFLFGDGTGFGNEGMFKEFDSKAMRIVPPGSNLTLSIQHGTVVSGTPDIHAVLTCRMLFALS